MRTTIILIAVLLGGVGTLLPAKSAEPAGAAALALTVRSRVVKAPQKVAVRTRKVTWQAKQTAVIICDMWNQHWCRGATRRVAEMAPRMNEFVSKARARGALIVHAPSSCMAAYKNHPARKRAQAAPRAKNLPPGIGRGGPKLATEKGATWPIDQSDGGCDCQPRCKGGGPWRSQIDTIEIRDEDAVSDSGVEIWNLFAQRGIKNVMLVGVHTNMCVIGRPFGLRNMVRCGKNVVLVRDMTDTMYNSRRRPQVSHVCGTYLIVQYIETYVCGTITSTDLTGKPPFVFADHFADPPAKATDK